MVVVKVEVEEQRMKIEERVNVVEVEVEKLWKKFDEDVVYVCVLVERIDVLERMIIVIKDYSMGIKKILEGEVE